MYLFRGLVEKEYNYSDVLGNNLAYVLWLSVRLVGFVEFASL